MNIPGISSAYRLYIDGVEKMAAGQPARRSADATAGMPSLTTHFQPRGPAVRLVLHVSNYDHWKGGLWESVVFGPTDSIQQRRVNKIALALFIFGAAFILGLYHLRLFVTLRHESTYLYFALFCLFICLRIFVIEERLIMVLLPDLTASVLFKLEYLSFYLGGAAMLGYLYHLFPREFNDRLYQGLQVVILGFAAAVIVLPLFYFSQTLKSFQILAFGCVFYSVWVLVCALARGRYGIKTCITGLLLFAASVVNDLLFAMGIVNTGYWFHFGSLAFLICQAFLLIDKYTLALDTIEAQKTALQESEAQKQAILDASIDSIRLVDTDLRIIWGNKIIESQTGRTREAVIGRHCYSLFTGRDEPCPDCPSLKALKSGKIEHAVICETDVKNIKGVTYWADYAVPFKGPSGEVERLIQVSRDITPLKTLEEKHRRIHKMEALGTMSGGIAHEFNNILSIIIGNTELALDEIPRSNPATENLEEIQTASLRAKDVVRQIMLFARKSVASPNPANLASAVREAVTLMRASIPTTIDIETDVRDAVQMVTADPSEIQQIVVNLCRNASQAMAETGLIRIRIESLALDDGQATAYEGIAAGEYAQLTIQDDGSGIAPEILDRIFDPYFTTKEVDQGLGMGLAVVYGIVTKHAGALSVASKPGRGTTVKVLLPATGQAPEAAGPAT